MTPTKNTKAPSASEYPPWWSWEDDGAHLEGTFVSAGRGHTANGEKTFLTLEVGGAQRTVWLHHTVLAATFAREVRRRPDKQLHAGERIEIWCLGEREGKGYIDYKVSFPDAPEAEQVDMFPMPSGVEAQPDEKTSAEPSTGGSGFDHDIPFQPAA